MNSLKVEVAHVWLFQKKLNANKNIMDMDCIFLSYDSCPYCQMIGLKPYLRQFEN